MKLKDARALQAEIHGWGWACTVPLGHGPDGYWCQIWTHTGTLMFPTRMAARKHRALRLRERRIRMRPPTRDTRTPIERMIDQACGIK